MHTPSLMQTLLAISTGLVATNFACGSDDEFDDGNTSWPNVMHSTTSSSSTTAADGSSSTEDSTGDQLPNTPKMTILVVVDGLRADLLEHYRPALSGGLQRLLTEGSYFSHAYHDHAPVVTAPGHATLATGMHPIGHGIVANSWHEQREGEWVKIDDAAVADPESPVLGLPGEMGVSPRQLQSSGIADWFRAQYPGAKTASVAGKNRVAAMMGGQSGKEVYWLTPKLPGFATSNYYQEAYPEWVETFNTGLADRYFTSPVTPHPQATHMAHLARRDDAAYENDGIHFKFPYTFLTGDDPSLASDEQRLTWMKHLPVSDQIVLDFAWQSIESLDMGLDDIPDFLAIGLSTNDRISHAFGPHSFEAFNHLVTLDLALAEFLDNLDQRLGTGNYTLALTSDHGFDELPESHSERGQFGHRIDEEQMGQLMGIVLGAVQSAKDAGTPDAEIPSLVAQVIAEQPTFDRAWTMEALATAAQDPTDLDEMTRQVLHGSFPGRVESPLVALGIAAVHQRLGVTIRDHGSAHTAGHDHNRHVPLVFFGRRQQGQPFPSHTFSNPVLTVDVAPSLAAASGITVPPGRHGRPLSWTSNHKHHHGPDVDTSVER